MRYHMHDAEEADGLKSGERKQPAVSQRVADVLFSKRCMVCLVLLIASIAVLVVVSSSPSPRSIPEPPPSEPTTTTIPFVPSQEDEDNALLPSSPTNTTTTTTDSDTDDDGGADCSPRAFARLLPAESYAHRLRLANCGGKTTAELLKPPSPRPFRIFLVGEDIRNNLHLSGCPITAGGCPLFPKCAIALAKSMREAQAGKADMVVVASGDHELARATSSKGRRPIRVLYQREPYWHFVDSHSQLADFDLTMTGFVNAGIMNPPFLRRPARLLPPHDAVLPDLSSKKHFALSIISLCRASSLRKIYLTHLTDYLGKQRVHQYGKCGNMHLPPPPITNALKVIVQYKFFLAFENSMLTNYVSEKLLTVLSMPLVPVYRGGLPSLRITHKPSYIDVADFASPKQLAIHLLRLDANPEEYAKYHEWRSDAEPFTAEYLELVAKQLPGKAEMEPLKHEPLGTRRAMCCRLCDPFVVAREMDRHGERTLIPGRITSHKQLNQMSFGGHLGVRHPGSLLVQDGNGSFVESGVREPEHGKAIVMTYRPTTSTAGKKQEEDGEEEDAYEDEEEEDGEA